jgi:hypothetical protein
MTEILHFEMNVPVEVALKYAGPGKPIEGRYGNRVMYTLADNRVMYVAPIVASRISDLGIQPGEVFHVCKQEKRRGPQKLIEWQVQRLASEPETQLERELQESIAIAYAAKATPPSDASEQPSPPASSVTLESPQNQEQPAQPTPIPAVVASSNGSSNGTPSPITPTGKSFPACTTKLEHALRTAISAAHNAERYGAELGYVVRFDADAIKSMAITVLINMSEGGRR